MIVNSIRLRNFKSYYGSENEFKFEKGLNIISGHEGSGKSNLFDAFMWILFNQISGFSGYEELNEDNISFINDRIKNERFKEKSAESIDCQVTVNLTIPKSIKHPEEVTYEITRSKVIKLNTATKKGNISWQKDNSRFHISWEDKSFNSKEEFDRGAESKLDKIFPDKIRKYIWFQGEKLNELLDFDNTETLRSAIDFISYLSTYEEMSDLIEGTNEMLTKRILNLMSKSKTHEKTVKKFTALFKSAEVELKKVKNDEKIYKRDLTQLEQEEAQETEKLAALAGYPELKAEKNNLLNRVNNLQKEIGSLNEIEKNLFVKKWMMKGMTSLLEESRKELSTFTSYRLSLISQNNKQLAEGTPGDDLVNKMLSKQHCLICDTPAPKGSDKFKSIEKHLDGNKNLTPLDPEIENLNEKVINLKGKPDNLLRKLSDVDSEIIAHTDLIAEKMEARNDASKKLKKVEKKIDDLISEKGQSTFNTDPDIIKSKIRLIKNDIKATTSKLNKCILDARTHNSDKQRALAELNKLKNKNVISSVEEKLTAYTEHIKRCINKQEESQRKNLIEKIQTKANEIQSSIANVNNIILVYVKIDPDNYSISFVDADGNPNPGHGAQNTLAKMSIINAIVSLSYDMKGIHYPFIADAPTSDFASVFTERFLQSIAKTYDQSIIVTKDLVEDSKKYKKEKYVSTFVEISKNEDNTKATSNNSITLIKN